MFLLRPLLRPFWSYCALFELLRPFCLFSEFVRHITNGKNQSISKFKQSII